MKSPALMEVGGAAFFVGGFGLALGLVVFVVFFGVLGLDTSVHLAKWYMYQACPSFYNNSVD